MTILRKFEFLILGIILVALFAYAPSFAEQIKGPVVSIGSAATKGGSLLNVGQTAMGHARSTSHRMKAGVIPVIILFAGQRVHGDLDSDGDVDLDDHDIFALCLSGPDVNTQPRDCTKEQFDLADLHVDQDVDLHDFAVFLDATAVSWSIN